MTKSDFPSASAAHAKRWADAIARDLTGKSRTIALDRLEAQLEIIETARAPARSRCATRRRAIVFSTAPALLVHIDREPVTADAGHTVRARHQYAAAPAARRARHASTSRSSTAGCARRRSPGLDRAGEVRCDLDRAFQQASARGSSIRSPANRLRTPRAVAHQDGARHLRRDRADGAHRDRGRAASPPSPARSSCTSRTRPGRVFRTCRQRSTCSRRALVPRRRARRAPGTTFAANALPADFAAIPDDSPAENVKASVAGTAQAREAAVAADVPQTASVKLAGTTLTKPRFDGEPVFAADPGTPSHVRREHADTDHRAEETSFYALQNGVWFAAPSVERAVDGRDLGAAVDLHDPAQLAALLRDVRAHLRGDRGRGLHRLHAGLPGHVHRS